MIRITKYTAALAAMTVLATFVLSAQPARMTPQERTDRMTKELSLTKEQQKKVLAIQTQAQDSMKAAFEEHQGDRDAMRSAMQQIRKDSDAQLKKVLTDEQYEKWTKTRAEGMGRGQGQGRQRGEGRGTTPPPDSTKSK